MIVFFIVLHVLLIFYLTMALLMYVLVRSWRNKECQSINQSLTYIGWNLQENTTWSHFVSRTWLFDLKTYRYISQFWNAHYKELFTWYWSLYLYHIAHYTKAIFTRRPLPLYYQILTSDWTRSIFYIFCKIVLDLRTLISETIHARANRIYFRLNQFRHTTCTVRCGGIGAETAHILRIRSFNTFFILDILHIKRRSLDY